MLPLNDTHPNRYSSISFMTMAIIVTNVLVMCAQVIMLETDLEGYLQFIQLYGTVPERIWQGEGGGALSAVTSIFLHADLMHLSSNMLALWVFGRRVEDATGPWRFLIYYLICGLLAVTVSTIISADSAIPTIGASGAIFGTMGAYLLLFPWGRIRTLIPIIIIPLFPRVRAIWIIFYFLALQIIPALDILVRRVPYNIDYWAHLGGFFGCLFIFFFLRPEALHRYRTNLPV